MHYNVVPVIFVLLQEGSTALHFACDEEHTDVVQVLLARGADPNLATHVSELSIVTHIILYFYMYVKNAPLQQATLLTMM